MLYAGQLLIAPPTMPDERFQESVMLLCHHSRTGSFALCVNKPTEYVIEDVISELDLGLDRELKFPLYKGGPVKPSSVWMLHSAEWCIEHTLGVNTEWSITSHDSMFAHLADGDCPREFRFCHGFASWGPTQLELELEGNHPWTSGSSWVIGEDPGPEWLFNQPEEELWDLATSKARRQAVDAWL